MLWIAAVTLTICYAMLCVYLAFDAIQTHGIFCNSARWSEQNPIIRALVGKFGNGAVWGYFGFWMLLPAAPAGWTLLHRQPWLTLLVAVLCAIGAEMERRVTQGNRRIGL